METNDFYDGSNLLLPISQATGMSIDKVNFLVCQLVALLVGFPYRIYLGPHRVSPKTRHFVQVSVGVPLLYFCFGWQMKHIFAQMTICLVIMRFMKPGLMEKVVFVIAMGYLCVTHIYRMIYDYGGYTLDVTGPLMISTQRLTSLAYNIADGQTGASGLSSDMKRLAVRKFPTLLEFFSYVFCFHGIMCGPFCFYKDYVNFIDGSNYRVQSSALQDSVNSHGVDAKPLSDPPDPTSALFSKSFCALGCGLLSALAVPRFLIISIVEPEFAEHSFWYKMAFIVISTSLHRQIYYFAWTLSELGNINAGLGFNGYGNDDRPLWDLISNTDIYQVETSSSLKVLLDNWNKMTTKWLRYVVYERCHSTLAVFLLSAFWHGFYIGYYITFLGGGVFIHVSRMVRRKVRPHFQNSAHLARFYDLVTFLATRIAIAYLIFPFVILEFWKTVAVYSQLFFWFHVAGALTGLIVLALPKPQGKVSKNQ